MTSERMSYHRLWFSKRPQVCYNTIKHLKNKVESPPKSPKIVTPAKAGVQNYMFLMYSGLRRNDG